MLSLAEWQTRWGIPEAAMRELAGVPVLEPITTDKPLTTEAGVQASVRLKTARAGWHMFRNNRGAFQDQTGRWIRYGLANDSKTLGDRLKSHDLIGWRPYVVQLDDVGKTIAQLVSLEIKPPGWRYTGTEREQAQLRWLTLVNASGGHSMFTTGNIE